MRYTIWLVLLLLWAGCSLFETGTKSDDTSQDQPPTQTERYEPGVLRLA
jgi:PBP1b-binding outer membrane lipoprotein LpoB